MMDGPAYLYRIAPRLLTLAELSLRMRSRKHAFVLNNAHVAMNECEIGEIQKS